MPRFSKLVELHDHRHFPGHLRHLVTDALQELWQFGDSYAPILPLLYPWLKRGNTLNVLDLCSGGGGPWPSLLRRLARGYRILPRVRLSDKYPNLAAFGNAQTRSMGQITWVEEPVDAVQVPPTLRGFRTIFSSFHHFDSKEAIKVLQNARKDRQGIGIFEVPQRDLLTILSLCFTPFLVLFLTLRIRPFRWSRLFWTYILPVVPLVIWYDGMVSCLKAYSLHELREMVKAVDRETDSADYVWQLGVERTGLLPVTYLVGTPTV